MTDDTPSNRDESENPSRPNVRDHIWHVRNALNDADHARTNYEEWDDGDDELDRTLTKLESARESLDRAIAEAKQEVADRE